MDVAGTACGVVAASGTARLNGALNVRTQAGQIPALGATLTPLRYAARSGSFASVVALPVGATSLQYTPTYGTASMTITRTNRPSITSLNPTRGPAGTSVRITGTFFGATKGTSSVKFGTTVAGTTAWADTQITATVPAGLNAGPVNVTVTTPGGTSAAAVFTMVTPPVIATLTSSTHPVEATWYVSNLPKLAWTATDLSGIAGYSYVIDHAATTVPDTVSEGTTASKAYTTALADGLWYFHVRARNGAGLWGATKTRIVRIDATPIHIASPIATSSWPSGSTQTVAWSVHHAVSTGEFRVRLYNTTTKLWYLYQLVTPVAGKTSYAAAVTLSGVPAGSHTAYVYYRPVVGTGSWAATGVSAAFKVTPINVTSPNAASLWKTGSTQTVTWTVNPAVSAGEFKVGFVNAAGSSWYGGVLVKAVAAKTSYAQALKLTCPAGGGYRAYVYYRPTVGSGSWTVTAKSAAFTVTP